MIEAVALNAPPLPLNNITMASLQAMISQAVENVIAFVKKPLTIWAFVRIQPSSGTP